MMLLQECKVYCSPVIVSSQTSRSIKLKIILQIVLCEYLLSIVPVLTIEGEGKKKSSIISWGNLIGLLSKYVQ
jgi:hypothetical protein